MAPVSGTPGLFLVKTPSGRKRGITLNPKVVVEWVFDKKRGYSVAMDYDGNRTEWAAKVRQAHSPAVLLRLRGEPLAVAQAARS